MPKKIILPKEQVDTIIKLYNSGLSYAQIQNKIGIDANKVKRTLKECGVEFRPHKKGDEIRRSFTDEEKQLAIELYLQGVGATGIAKIIKCSPMPLKKMLSDNGIKIRNCEESHDFQKKGIKEDYFDVIDHQDKAYMLGLWFADGCNHVGNAKKEYTVALTLQASDVVLLEKIREKLGMERKIKINTRESDGRSYARLEFKNKHISLRFCDLGIVPRKTFITQFPDYLSDDLIPHFIRGLLDGDGCISHDLKTIQFAGSHAMMCGLVEQFQKHLGFTAHIIKIKHSPGISSVAIARMNYKVKLVHWLYDNADLRLERKFDLAMQMLEKYEPKLAG